MRIKIEGRDDGSFAIESECPGPHSTIKVLRNVIEAVEKAALETELRTANAATTVQPTTNGELQKILHERWQGGMK